MQFKIRWIKLLGILVFLLAQNALSAVIVSDRKPLGKGYVYSWIEKGIRHEIKALGISITGSAMNSLPETAKEIVLQPKSAHTVLPFKHFTVDWNPQGHEPPHIYDTPHFDFHFYTITEHERHMITCQGANAAICTKAPLADYIAADYAPTPDPVPMMGWHWVDLKAPEFNGLPFTATFIYGYHNAKLIFLEPMITVEYFETHPQTAFMIREPAKVSQSGLYPRRYFVRFNAAMDTYDTIFMDFHYRAASK